jgi:hypothetical protein
MLRLKYSPLDGSIEEIRLMTLLAGSFADDIHVVLRKIPFPADNITHIPKYEALSYTWGSKSDLVDIIIDEGSSGRRALAVTRNLATALPYLRYEHTDRVLWIDAICVDQLNLDERSSQVERMADIYSCAERVVIWLGPETDETAHAFDLLSLLASRIEIDWVSEEVKSVLEEHSEWVAQSTDLTFNEVEWSALHSVFSRPWFERLWVRQEVLLAGSIILTCGFSGMPWHFFRSAAKCLFEKPRPIGIDGAWNDLTHIAVLVTFDVPSSLGHLIYQTRYCKCSDPRDRVYAVLSLLKEEDRKRWIIKPDYTNSISAVYKDVSLSYMTLFQSPELLRFCDIGRKKVIQDLPSWAADWSCIESLGETLPNAMAHGNSSGVLGFSEDKKVLHTVGRIAGTVREVKEFTFYDNTPYAEVMLELQHIAPPNILTEGYHNGETLLDAFCRTIIVNSLGDSWDPPKQIVTMKDGRDALQKMLTSDSSIESIKALNKDEKARDYIDIVSWYSQRRAFISTQDGYIGVAPTATLPGDIVVVSLGCSSPLVIRPTGTSVGKYCVVGECYLDGYMRAEAFLGPLPEDYGFITKFDDQRGNYRPAFIDKRTQASQFQDPRYELLLGEGFERRINFNNCDKDEDRNKMLILEALQVRGIQAQCFDII